MKRRSEVALFVLGLALTCQPGVAARMQHVGAPGSASQSGGSILPAEWGRFAPHGAGFSVLMPGTPKGEERTFQLESGKEATSALYMLRKGALEYVVSYTPLAADIRDEALANSVFDRARDGAVTRMNAKVVDERAVTVAGRPGRRIKLVASNTFVEMYSVLSDYKLIGLIVETPGATETPELAAAADRFFASLDTTY